MPGAECRDLDEPGIGVIQLNGQPGSSGDRERVPTARADGRPDAIGRPSSSTSCMSMHCPSSRFSRISEEHAETGFLPRQLLLRRPRPVHGDSRCSAGRAHRFLRPRVPGKISRTPGARLAGGPPYVADARLASVTSSAVFPSGSFLRYWRAEAVSGFGTYVTLFALQTLVVLTLHGSAADVGWLNAASTAPYLVFSLVVGAVVDGKRRLPLMVSTDLMQAVLLLAIPML